MIAQCCLLPATGRPWNSFPLELVSYIGDERVVSLIAFENTASRISVLVKHVFWFAFTKGIFGENASLEDPLFFHEVHTMSWEMMAEIHLDFEVLFSTPTWSLSSSIRSKNFFKLFFKLSNDLINQSSSDCVWWKVKTKLVFLFFFLPPYFSNKIILRSLICFINSFDLSEVIRDSHTDKL